MEMYRTDRPDVVGICLMAKDIEIRILFTTYAIYTSLMYLKQSEKKSMIPK